MAATIEDIKAGIENYELQEQKYKQVIKKNEEEFNKETEAVKKAKEWLDKDVNFKSLKKTGVFLQHTNPDGSLQESAIKKLTPQQISEIGVNYFLSAGLDYKGQHQSCYQADGIEGGLNVQFDFSRLISGIFSTEVSVDTKGTFLIQKILIAQVGPSEIDNYKIPKPILINYCEGVKFRGTVKAGLFVGVAVDAGFEFGLAVPGADMSVALKARADAGAKANADLSGDYFYAEDNGAEAFEKNDEKTKKALSEIMTYKRIAETVIEKGKKITIHRIKPNIITSVLISSCGGNGNMNIGASAEAGLECRLVNASVNAQSNALLGGSYKTITVRYQTAYYAENLASQVSIRPSPQTLNTRVQGAIQAYSSWNPSPETKAAIPFLKTLITNDANVLDSAVRFFLGLSTKPPISAPGIKKLKVESTFYGLLLNAYQKAFVVMTQDTRVLYQQFKYGANASASVQTAGRPPLISAKIETNNTYNRMSYQTTTVFWYSETKRHPYLQIPRVPSSNTKPKEFQVKALKGSGISFGGSFLLKDLKEALEFKFFDYLPINTAIPTEDHQEIPLEIINSRPMQYEIKNALKDFDENYLQKTYLAKKPKAAQELEKLISEGKSVNNLVAWLIQDPKRDISHFDYIFNYRFQGKHCNAKSNNNTTKTKFFDKLKEAYEKGKTREKQEADAQEREKATQIRLQAEQDKRNRGIEEKRNQNIRNKEFNDRLVAHNELGKKQDQFLENIAISLNVTLKQLRAFFETESCLGMILDHETAFPGLDAILLEASFKAEPTVTLRSSLIQPSVIPTSWKNGFFSRPDPTEELIELSPNTANQMLKTFKTQGKGLNAIRMRFRIQDAHHDEKTLFKLGFKVLGTGAKIELKALEEAGSEGIFDLHTEWFNDQGEIIISDLISKQKYEDGVPPVALFCQ